MTNAILLHGKPSKEEYYDPKAPSMSNAHWFPWLQGQLLKHDIWAATPEVPNAWKPYYPLWQQEFERFDITPETILVGHSCGAGFLVRWLSEHKDTKVGKVVLVAPSLGIDWVEDDFFGFQMDPRLVSRTKGVTIFGSDNDKPAIGEAIARYRAAIENIAYREFRYGHFTTRYLPTGEFPELLDEILA